jgi:ATP-dependent helicase/nuclease subunit A
VVLPDLARTSRAQSPLVACRPDLGLVVRPPQAGPAPADGAAEAESRDPVWRAYLTLERIDDEHESLRLFYVAATRARDALVLSAGLGPDEPVKATSIAMRLLDERFDRRTGACRIPPDPDDPGPPSVRVHLMHPPEPRGDVGQPGAAAPHAPRLSISAIEETIAKAGAAVEDEPSRPGVPPRYLDLEPSAGLSPRVARLDALVRSIVRDPRWRRREMPALGPLADRAGARQVPAAGPGLIRDAVRRLDALWNLSAFRALRAAASGAEAVVTDDLEFTLAPADIGRSEGRPATVFHGSGDLAFRDREGRWHLIVVADARACAVRQRLRLQLAAMSARARGFEPIARGWLVRHGPDGAAREEVVTQFDEEMVVRTLAELIG